MQLMAIRSMKSSGNSKFHRIDGENNVLSAVLNLSIHVLQSLNQGVRDRAK